MKSYYKCPRLYDDTDMDGGLGEQLPIVLAFIDIHSFSNTFDFKSETYFSM